MSTTALATQPATAPAVQTPKASALVLMASRYSVEPAKLLDTLKQTAFKGANDAQMMALVIVANEHKLNPFTKEIYAFPDKSGGIVPVISVDGWYRKMNEHPDFNGLDIEFKEEGSKVIACTASIYRKSREHPTTVTEYVDECKRNTDPWNKQPRRMIRHRAIVQCIRIAFGIAGMDPEDAERMRERDVTPPNVAPPVFQKRLPVQPPVEPTTDHGGFADHDLMTDLPEGHEEGEGVAK
jgi:phage recombination protein Bet